MMTGCEPGAARRLRPPLLRRRRRPDEGQPLGPDPRADLWHLLSDAGRSVVSLNLPGTYPPPNVRGVVVSGMDAPHLDAALSAAPSSPRRLRAEAPDYSLRYFWKRAPQSLEELTENARLTAESFRGRAEGGLLADRIVPDWSALMVQFQNLDPFQHRAWRY